MGDRAQYFLEQSIPELLDLQEKKIFTPLEIKAITRKRTSFENALTRKIVRKADFLRYAEYEINLEALRVQRVKRLQIKGKKSISDWAGPRRIFFIFERATKRFHGDVELWLQYIDYAKQEKSNKVLGKAYTALLQFHPTNPLVWNLAANHEMNWNGNMTAARTLMQRGLRLNTGATTLWLDYFKLELLYLRKIYARRHILGIDRAALLEEDPATPAEEDENSDSIKLPTITQGELDGNDRQTALAKDVELSTLTTSKDNPALQGAIPKAILNSATKSMPRDPQLLLSFHDALADFDDLPFKQEFSRQIVETLSESDFKTLPKACFLRAILPISMLHDDVQNPEFPSAFKQSLARYKQAEQDTTSVQDLVRHWTGYMISTLLAMPGLETHLKKAICATIRAAFKSVDLDRLLYTSWINFEVVQERHSVADALVKEAKAKFDHFSL